MDRVVGWSTLAVVTIVTVLFLTLSQVSRCVDAAPGEGMSSCSSEPLLGITGTWIAGVVAAGIVAWSVRQIGRAGRSSEHVED